MAHELTHRANGKVEMAYVGETPWHGLGQQLQPDTAIESWQEAAGMDWKIQRSKVRYFADREGSEQLEIPSQHVLLRSDNKAALGIVSEKYKVVQPREVLEFFRDLTETAGFKLETAGTLFEGKKFWALARTGETANIVGNDQVASYLLLATSCDGSSATVADFTGVRVVCNNTISLALRSKSKKRIDVSHRTVFNAEQVKRQLGVGSGLFASFVEGAQHLAKVKLSTRDAHAIVRTLLRPAKAPEDAFKSFLASVTEADERAPRGEAEILRLFHGAAIGSNLAGVQGTAWGLLNAVTEYVDHRTTAKSDSHRINSAWFNGGDDLKTATFEKLLTLA